jgi:hypothetical protein
MWYYAIGQERKGPVSQEEMEALITSGKLTHGTLVWREGMPQWVPLSASPLAHIPGAVPDPVPYVEGRTVTPGTSPWRGPDMSCGPDGTDLMFRNWWLSVGAILVSGGILAAGAVGEVIPVIVIGALLTLASVVFQIIFYCKFMYRCWMLVSDGKARTSPGYAVGLNFIPLFNFYWQFIAYWGLALEMNRVIDEYRIPAPRPNTQLALAYCILSVGGVMPLIGGFVSLHRR